MVTLVCQNSHGIRIANTLGFLRHRQQRPSGRSVWWPIFQHQLVGWVRHRLYRYRLLSITGRAGSCCGHRGRWWIPGPGPFRQVAFNALVLCAVEPFVFESFSPIVSLSCFIQVACIEFPRCKMDRLSMYSSCRSIFSGCSFLLGLTALNLLDRRHQCFPG